jgi:poly-gamma-glutamate synthesis protein (capsule biosynthesis protein)
MTKKGLYVVCALAVLAAVVFQLRRRAPDAPRLAAVRVLPPDGPLTVAATGDVVLGRPLASADRDSAFEAIVRVVRDATVAIGNLEMNLLGPASAEVARSGSGPRWTFGTAREAAEIESLGFDVVGQANNHALDYGTDGMRETRAVLAAAGLMTAGSGRNLDEAGAPLVIGGGPRRIAVVAVAISHSSSGVATPAGEQGSGWPGINAVRYVADITADAETFDLLRRAMPDSEGDAAGARFTSQGAVVRKGAETTVNLVPDPRDIDRTRAAISRARAEADVVLVSLHAHEPSNISEEPADFVRAFARQAIDAGALLVVGHGPPRLRGVEVYNGGAILYSLGTFLRHPEQATPLPDDPYDAGSDMFSLAMGMTAGRSGAAAAADERREAAVALATFVQGRLAGLQLHPVAFGAGQEPSRGWIPRRPELPLALATLETVARLSRPMGTTIRIDQGIGHLDIR